MKDDVKIKVIDSDKLINAINEGSYDVNLSAVMALGAVTLDTKKRHPESKWIPVSKKAHPDKEGRYLVTDDAGGMATVDVDDFIYCDDGSGMWLYSQNVTAWMPRPEPYRKEAITNEND